MATMTPATHPELLFPALAAVHDSEYKRWPFNIEDYYTRADTNLASEEVTSLGSVRDVPEFTSTLEEDSPYQGYVRRIPQRRYALQMKISKDLIRFDQSNRVIQQTKKLTQSATRTKTRLAMRIFNNAFSGGAFLSSDGLTLINGAHTTTASPTTTYDNRIQAGAPPFSYDAVAAGIAGEGGMDLKDDRNQPILSVPDTLLYHPTLHTRVIHAANSVLRPGVADNDVSAISGDLSGGAKPLPGTKLNLICSAYLTSRFRWFLMDMNLFKSNCYWFDSEEINLAKVGEWSTFVVMAAITWMSGNNTGDWRGLQASNATT